VNSLDPRKCFTCWVDGGRAQCLVCRDELRLKYFARAGYACVRVDMRGSGDSEGQVAVCKGDMHAGQVCLVCDSEWDT
jgi:predicted acyl esterase